ncbi:choice-of-anchor M domain-containing protein [Nocardioides daejeonensis]|uniref:choice-of-anchor M domain-containing protein n=1 Tax=Nocardioides daejeonensis TaxID=1046556 RepID=UPI000D743457|nr:choice-of-anchor M domain-containing protein [Nocardioides daejeonensis]
MSFRPLSSPVAWLLAAAALVLATPMAALADEDPHLEQELGDLEVVHGERVLDAGHVDMGPKYVDGAWTFLIHDDVAKADADAKSVWRYPDETVFHVLDDARLEVPDDAAYSFIGADPGAPVWVVPQTQNPGVVWLGWNTQDPEVMRTIDRGVTLSLTGVQGPGDVSVYLQSGTFGEPQVLWESGKDGAQPLWVDVNTHTHANWTFTEPGVYLLRLRAEADLVDGSHVSDSQIIRLAVGSRTSTDEALSTAWEGPAESTGGEETAAGEPAAAEEENSVLVPVLVGAIVVVAVALIVGFGIGLVRGNRARKQVLAGRSETQRDADASPGDADGEESR